MKRSLVQRVASAVATQQEPQLGASLVSCRRRATTFQRDNFVSPSTRRPVTHVAISGRFANKIGNVENVNIRPRPMSSVAAVPQRQNDENDEGCDHEQDNCAVTSVSSASSHRRNKNMPRLEELRERLKNEAGIPGEERSSNSEALKSFATSGSRSPLDKSVKLEQHTKKDTTNNATSKDSLEFIHQQLHRLKQQQQKQQQQQQENSGKMSLSPVITPESMLTDTYNRHHTYLRISLTERCNFRCQYCMPPEGVPLQPQDKLLTDDEIVKLVHWFVQGGVNKIRLTGGEPLLRPNLAHLLERISSEAEAASLSETGLSSLGITTNGLTLSRHLPSLLSAGLTHVNISLDTLDETKFLEITRRNGLSKVLQAIDDAVAAFPDFRVKINCVVMKGFNDDELWNFVAQFTKDAPVDVRFIEWMPFFENGWNDDRFVSYQDMLYKIVQQQRQQEERGGEPISAFSNDNNYKMEATEVLERLSDGPNDTTKWYRAPGHVGRIGFITSMSEHFCGTCNRLRITADGQLKVCLFGKDELNLKQVLQALESEGGDKWEEEDVRLLIGAAVRRKTFALGGHGNMYGIQEANENRPMTLIGG